MYPFDIQVFDADDKVVADLVTTLLRLGEADPGSSSSALGVGVVVPVVADVVPGLDNSPTLDDAGAERMVGTIAAIAARPDVPMTLTPSAESLFLLEDREMAGGATAAARPWTGCRPAPGARCSTGPYAPIDTGSWVDSGLVGEMDQQYAGTTASPPSSRADRTRRPRSSTAR